MSERGWSLIPSVLALTVAALLVAPMAASAASGLPASVTMAPEAAGPGASIEVTGLDFPSNQAVDLQLTTTAGPVHLGTATTVDDGYFRQAFTLPQDAPAGYWELRATASDGSVAVHLFESSAAVQLAAAADTASGTVASSSGNSAGDIMVMLVFALLSAGVGGGAFYVYYQSKLAGVQPGMSDGADPIWSGAATEADTDPSATATDEPTWTAAHSKT